MSIAKAAAQDARDAAEESRRATERAFLPDLHAAVANDGYTVQLRVTNAGGGLAKRVGFVLQVGNDARAGYLDVFLRPRETRIVETGIAGEGQMVGRFAFIVFCDDRRDMGRWWSHDSRTGEAAHKDGSVRVQDLWETVHPDRPWREGPYFELGAFSVRDPDL